MSLVGFLGRCRSREVQTGPVKHGGPDVISKIPSQIDVFCVQAKWPSKGTATSDISFLVRSEGLLAHDVTSGDTEHTEGCAE